MNSNHIGGDDAVASMINHLVDQNSFTRKRFNVFKGIGIN